MYINNELKIGCLFLNVELKECSGRKFYLPFCCKVTVSVHSACLETQCQ